MASSVRQRRQGLGKAREVGDAMRHRIEKTVAVRNSLKPMAIPGEAARSGSSDSSSSYGLCVETPPANANACCHSARIEHYRFGAIEIAGRAYANDVIATPERVIAPWWRKEGHTVTPTDLLEIIAARHMPKALPRPDRLR